MSVKMTYRAYDKLCTKMEKVKIERGIYWPTPEEIEILGANFDKTLEYIVWLVETGEAPVSSEAKESFRLLNKLLRDNIDFVDG